MPLYVFRVFHCLGSASLHASRKQISQVRQIRTESKHLTMQWLSTSYMSRTADLQSEESLFGPEDMSRMLRKHGSVIQRWNLQPAMKLATYTWSFLGRTMLRWRIGCGGGCAELALSYPPRRLHMQLQSHSTTSSLPASPRLAFYATKIVPAGRGGCLEKSRPDGIEQPGRGHVIVSHKARQSALRHCSMCGSFLMH